MSNLSIMSKIKKISENIPEKYDISAKICLEIRNNSICALDAVTNGFYIGFAQGQKAKEAELKTVPEEIKTKNDLRKAITSSIYKNKNKIVLNHIFSICEMYRKQYDEKEYIDLSELESEQVHTI